MSVDEKPLLLSPDVNGINKLAADNKDTCGHVYNLAGEWVA